MFKHTDQLWEKILYIISWIIKLKYYTNEKLNIMYGNLFLITLNLCDFS